MQPTHQQSRSAQSRFFAYIQKTSWYRQFFQGVVDALADLAPASRVLDIGTGPGKLLALLRQELALDCTGVDADQAMLSEARGDPTLSGVALVHVPVGQALPFPSHSIDAICFCSVLYLLEKAEVFALLEQAETLLRPHGRIVILTPTGTDHSRVADLRQHWTFYLWRRLTAATGRHWQNQHLATDFAEGRGMTYVSHSVFSDMATVEVITVR